jgi:tryptophan-rich sensory protein
VTTLPRSRQILGLASWLGITFAAAVLGAIASAKAGAFYQELARPGWAPPAALFAPVWSLLYLLMGIAAWLIWREQGFRGARIALGSYLIQLFANALWTWLFFQWRLGAIALAEILLLWAMILATVVAFWRIRPFAAVLLLPYWAWVTFAAALTYATWKLNPHLLA